MVDGLLEKANKEPVFEIIIESELPKSTVKVPNKPVAIVSHFTTVAYSICLQFIAEDFHSNQNNTKMWSPKVSDTRTIKAFDLWKSGHTQNVRKTPDCWRKTATKILCVQTEI